MIIFACLALASSQWRGVDASFVPEYRDLKVPFYVGDRQVDPLEALAKAGNNLLRLRIWVNPKDKYCDLDHTLKLARDGKKLGMALMLDFHYSDWWADPGHQTIPEAWKDLSVDQLQVKVSEYTTDILNRLIKQGTAPRIIQIGNEIRAGFMWPAGKMYENGWPNFLKLVQTGCAAARKASPTSELMLHTDSGADNGACRFLYDKFADAKIDYDIIGLSYYPWWHGSLDNLRLNVTDLASRYKKKVMIAETAYPFTLAKRRSRFVETEKQLLDGYPATEEGQSKFLEEVKKIVAQIPGGLGAGVVYWAPEYVAAPGIQTPYDNLCLFDYDHRMLQGAYTLGNKQKPKR